MQRATFPLVTHTMLWREDGHLLLIRRRGTGFADGYFNLPGGHLEPRETPSEAAVRECSEEVGLELDAGDLAPVCVMPYRTSRGAGVNFIFEAQRWRGEAVIAEPEYADQLRWVDPASLPEPSVPFLALALEDRRAGRWYHEFGSDAAYRR